MTKRSDSELKVELFMYVCPEQSIVYIIFVAEKSFTSMIDHVGKFWQTSAFESICEIWTRSVLEWGAGGDTESVTSEAGSKLYQ